MHKNEDYIHFSRNYKIGLIFSLIAIIGLFLYMPDIKGTITESLKSSEPVITVVDIPQTKNAEPSGRTLLKPLTQNLTNLIPVEEDIIIEEIILEDIPIETRGEREISDGLSSRKGIDVYAFSALPFIPRQILEVIPKEIDGAEGQILLSIRIAKDGSVKEHKIISDNTNKSECLKNVLTAVYKSRWQPITIDGERVEYWVEKLYGFK